MNEKSDIKIRILEAAKELFARYGFTRVRTSEVANILGMSKRTLYENYPSKEALFTAVVDDVIESNKEKIKELIRLIQTEPEEDFFNWLTELWDMHLKTVSVFTKEFLTDIEKVSPENWKKIKGFRDEQFKENFETIYSTGVAKGYLKANLDKEIIYLTYIYAFGNILRPDIISRLPLSITDIIKNISEILFAGTMTDKGREHFVCGLKKNTSNITIT